MQLTELADIFRAHPNYSGVERMEERLNPEHTIIGGGIIITWNKPATPAALRRMMSGDVLHEEDWSDTGPVLWICDMISIRDMLPRDIVRVGTELLVLNGIAERGDLCLYRRNNTGRFGRMRVRHG